MKFGLPTVLFLIFLVLKLLNKIAWSWWWVTSPLWISFGLWVLILAVFAIWASCSPLGHAKFRFKLKC